ncbi:MAG: hypothetical protein IJY46_09740 [Lentisphaeria bacterium]|nr:hypothetical protein [Lentisphaeria bacterium]
MKRFFTILAALTIGAAGAIELNVNGSHEHIALNWKNTMAYPAFTVSFKVRMNKKDMVLPASVKNRGRILFQLNSGTPKAPGLQNIKIFFSVPSHPAGGYAGIQSSSKNHSGKEERIRYNVFWRAENSQVPTDEFVTVTLVYADGRLDAYLNQQNHAALHKLMTHTIIHAAPEYQMSFGGMGKRYSVPCAIKDIAIFDRALTAQDAKLLATGTKPQKIIGLLAYYPLEKNGNPAVASSQIKLKVIK